MTCAKDRLPPVLSFLYDDLLMPVRCLVVVLALSVSAAACKGNPSPTSPSLNVPFSITELRVGSGAEATTGRSVTVNYTGWLYDTAAVNNKGRQFDSSLDAGRTPLAVTLGAGRVIPGFERGIIGMRTGGQRRVIIPPDLAYGSAGSSGVIPPNATLIFEIELLTVQ